MSSKETGTVKWFDAANKGFGFITPDKGGEDIFVHMDAVKKGGLRDLREGDKVQFVKIPGKKPGQFKAEIVEAAT